MHHTLLLGNWLLKQRQQHQVLTAKEYLGNFENQHLESLPHTHQLGSSLAGSGDIHTAVTGPGLAICTQIWAFQMQVLVN